MCTNNTALSSDESSDCLDRSYLHRQAALSLHYLYDPNAHSK
ncbi:hypothetical protein [Scytonema sp. PCC 10023]